MRNEFSISVERAETCSQILSKSRIKANLSRRDMSHKLGVSESTIKAWENGSSAPSLTLMLEWFDITGCNMFRPILDFLWPDIFLGLGPGSSENKLLCAVSFYLNKVAGEKEIQKLHYLVIGQQPDMWLNLLELFCAYAHMSIMKRHHILELSRLSFEIRSADKTEELPSFIEPDHYLIVEALKASKEAAWKHNNGFMIGFHNLPISEISATVLKESRADSNISMQYMAKALHKSERTIYNWETIIEPSFLDLCSWFSVVDKNIWFYLRNALNPSEPRTISQENIKLREELIRHFSSTPSSELHMIAYLIFGEHGSYWNAVLEMMLEHRCIHLSNRVLIARSIVTGYEADINDSTIHCSANIMPNMDRLEMQIEESVSVLKSRRCFPEWEKEVSD